MSLDKRRSAGINTYSTDEQETRNASMTVTEFQNTEIKHKLSPSGSRDEDGEEANGSF